jgi:two-component system response regulator AlgR
MDGIELAHHLSLLEQPPAVIFVTAFDAYAVQAFELNAVDYLLKPVRAQRLLAALQKVRQSRAADARPPWCGWSLRVPISPLTNAVVCC